jgi:NAD-dependent oxidoreductase involved in siderophore biosynthesis
MFLFCLHIVNSNNTFSYLQPDPWPIATTAATPTALTLQQSMDTLDKLKFMKICDAITCPENSVIRGVLFLGYNLYESQRDRFMRERGKEVCMK